MDNDLISRGAAIDGYTSWCVLGPCSHETPSNADRIRSMSDEELAEWIFNGISTDPCDYCEYNNGYCDGAPCRGKADSETIVGWLKQPCNCKKEERSK